MRWAEMVDQERSVAPGVADRRLGQVSLRRSGDQHATVDALLAALRTLGEPPSATLRRRRTKR